jgi:hypothetical protein
VSNELARPGASSACQLEHISRGSELVDKRIDEFARHHSADSPVRYGFVTEVGGSEVVELSLRLDQASDRVAGVALSPHGAQTAISRAGATNTACRRK